MDFKNWPIVQKINAAFLNFCALVAYFIIMSIALAISAKFALFLSIGVLVFCIAFFIRPSIFKLPNWWSKASAVVLALFTMIYISIANDNSSVESKANKEKELAELKVKDPRKYISELKSSPDTYSLYLHEFKSMYPEEYKIEMERVAKVKAEALAKEYQELKKKLENVKALSEQQKLDLYSQLLKHEPENKSFKKEREKYQQIVNESKRKEAARQLDIANQSEARANPENFLELVDFSWSKEGFGAVMEATFVIKNKSPIDIKDISIVCKHSAASGTVMDKNSRVVYEVIKAKSKKTLRNVNMGFIDSQAVSSSCYIDDAVAM